MVKYIPNILSMVRIILSVLLIPLISVSIVFNVAYIIVGITDVLDGLIARKLGCESDFGAKLDSIADFIFYSIFFIHILKATFFNSRVCSSGHTDINNIYSSDKYTNN